jgi:adenine C2-methylase RlmN of 23S rRNA A2503 and tRNA A37
LSQTEMAPKRREFQLRSIWDDSSVVEILSRKHALKLWNWIATHPDKSLDDALEQEWVINRVPRQAAQKIKENFVLSTSRIAERYDSNRGDTTKLLVELHDGHRIETVVMKHDKRTTVCVSSQIGCQMGCKFCATGTLGIIGDLASAEILEQLMHAIRVAKIRNVVFMGMGEPLNNFENVKKSIEFMVDEKRFGLSPRHVTVSTVGVIKNMRRLTEEIPNVNLALSLHAPNQAVRVKIVPAASAHKMDKLIEAVDHHIIQGVASFSHDNGRDNGRDNSRGGQNIDNKQVRRALEKWYGVMIEYILIDDVNDREEHAHELAALLSATPLRRKHIILNLIPYNPTEVAESYRPPTRESVERFTKICMSEPYCVTTRVRKEMGQDIAGACGQLALVQVQKDKNNDDSHGHEERKDGTQDKPLIQDLEDIAKPAQSPRASVNVSAPTSTSQVHQDAQMTRDTVTSSSGACGTRRNGECRTNKDCECSSATVRSDPLRGISDAAASPAGTEADTNKSAKRTETRHSYAAAVSFLTTSTFALIAYLRARP